ncbi:MAG: lysophospholipid acyltransferase family protein [Bacteroidia bacterium]|nr:lysophospholipid acyltransferase family protein [Bacteroidia bacterium]
MIKSSHAKSAKIIFDVYLSRLLKKHFHTFKVQSGNLLPDENRSILLLANHFSWWDGFFWYYLNGIFWKKKFHIMMLEKQLNRYWFFRFLGAFSVRKNSRSVMESFEYTSGLLKNSNNLVLIFPQGEIQPLGIEKIKFERGIELLKTSGTPRTQTIFGYAHTEYGSNPKPAVYFFIRPANENTVSEMECAYHLFRKECIGQLP